MNIGKESENMEFKKTTGELKEAMISMAAILNKHGVGTLYFGIKSNGDVVGQTVSESTLRDVSRLVYESIKPQIYPAITEMVIDGHHIIRVEFEGSNKPYSAFGRYYLRTADEDRDVTPSELKQFFVANEYKEKWEMTVTDISVKNIDKKSIKNFCTKAISAGRLVDGKYSATTILSKYNLSHGEYLTNAGNILFGTSHPVTLKAAVFATNEKLTFLDMQMYEDNIYNLINLAEKYILQNIRWKIEIVGTEREEIPEIPVAVIREVLANAFAHAIYGSNTNHEIAIFSDKITIYSPGPFASNYKPEDYITHNFPSAIRNAVISKILYLNKSIEQFGSGFKRIDSLCKDARVKYSYEPNEYGFTFIIYRKEITKDIKHKDKNLSLNKTDTSVYKLLATNPNYSRDKLAELTSKTVRTIQRSLDSLKNKHLIERVGSDKFGYWKVNPIDFPKQ